MEQKIKYLTLSDVQQKLGGRGRSTFFCDVETGRLPRPMKIGARLYWLEPNIDAAIAALAE